MSRHIITHLSKPRECTTPTVSLNVHNRPFGVNDSSKEAHQLYRMYPPGVGCWWQGSLCVHSRGTKEHMGTLDFVHNFAVNLKTKVYQLINIYKTNIKKHTVMTTINVYSESYRILHIFFFFSKMASSLSHPRMPSLIPAWLLKNDAPGSINN